MLGLRAPELLIIGIICLVLFGGKKLPELGAGLGKSIRDFKKAMSGEDDPVVPEAKPEETAGTRERLPSPEPKVDARA